MDTTNPPNTQRVVELDVTLNADSLEEREIRKKTSAAIGNLPQSLSDPKETHALSLSFSEDFERNIRIGVQATVGSDGDMLAIHLVMFEGDFCFGRGFAWVPFRQTMSFAATRADDSFSLDCYVTYKAAGSGG